MKVFEIPMLAMSLLGFGLLSGVDTPPAYADFTFGAPVNLKSVIPVLDPAYDVVECLSYDGLEMYVGSLRPGGQGDWDLWALRRPSIDDDWGPAENLGPAVNTSNTDDGASISVDGLTLYFNSRRPGGYGSSDIYMTTRATKNDPWGPPVNLGPKVNSSASDALPWISADGLELYFSSVRPGGYGNADIYIARRATQNDPWGQAVNLGPIVNSVYSEQYISLSPDGLLLLFGDYLMTTTPRPGGYGGSDMWMTRRATLSDPWQTPVNLGPIVNSSAYEALPRISPDGRTLYFWSDRGGSSPTWQAPITPIVDFNADGKVDLVDLVMLINDWGKTKTLCDIGPMPWGDGKVDIEDLKVFMTYYEKENQPVKP